MKLYTVTGPIVLLLLTSCGGSGDNPPSPSQECHSQGGETVCTEPGRNVPREAAHA